MRTCPFNGCGKKISDRLFACWVHWKSIPGNLQKEIYAAYDDYLEDRIGCEELRRRQQAVLDRMPGGPHLAGD